MTEYDKSIDRNADYWFYKGEELRKEGNIEKALDAFEKGLKLNPVDTTILWHKGHVLSELGRFDDASKSYLKAVELENNPEELYMMSSSLEWDGWYKTALKAINKALNIEPNNPEYVGCKGLILEDLKRYEEALVIYDKRIKLEPDWIEGYYDKGDLLNKLGRYREAIKVFDILIELNPTEPYSWYLKAITLSKISHNIKIEKFYNEAIEVINKAIEKKPNVPSYWYNRASIFSLNGNKGYALRDLSKAIILRSRYKEKARKDEAFKILWDDDNFKQMTR